MPLRALQAPSRSLNESSEDTWAIGPAPVCSQPRKPGTFSSITPPPAEVGGPQQGGLSRPSTELSLQAVVFNFLSAGVAILIPLIFISTPYGQLLATCTSIMLRHTAAAACGKCIIQQTKRPDHGLLLKGGHGSEDSINIECHIAVDPFQDIFPGRGQAQNVHPPVTGRNSLKNQSLDFQGFNLPTKGGHIHSEYIRHLLHKRIFHPADLEQDVTLHHRHLFTAAVIATGCIQQAEAPHKNL